MTKLIFCPVLLVVVTVRQKEKVSLEAQGQSARPPGNCHPGSLASFLSVFLHLHYRLNE